MSTEAQTLARPGIADRLRQLAPLFVIAGAMALFFAFGLGKYLSFDALRENRHLLAMLVEDHAILSVVAFAAIYAAVTALSVPGGAVLSIAGGFLFGSLLGTGAIVIGATIGATAIFVAARTALGETLRKRAGPWLSRMEEGFKENAFNYLLVLRLVPLFPFFVVNLVPALLGVPLRTYFFGTLIGIIPGAFVFASVGAGLGSVFDSNQAFTPASALTPEVIIALVGLSVLSLVPVAYKKFKTRSNPA